ncbi:GntR family transcriptional regulator [Arthrobacter castelli]|uniref:GntR family transcriptional regulator n=1 Tax=Arthrobacter castelli TaxID=271431 RepID=UPI0004016B28|nr:GntR family transcriptional regulator [Arthrobacter castelli]
MIKQATYGKRALVVEALADRIRCGEFSHGQQLDGEYRLAEEYSVSRGTIRQALGELQRRRLISTSSGIGSFVTFDGHQLDQRGGWAQALAGAGAELGTRLLDIAPVKRQDVPLLPEDVDLTEAMAVRRIRTGTGSDGQDRVLSFECSTIPSTGNLADLPRTGLIDGSLWQTLKAEGLIAATGEQRVDVRMLDEREAGILGRTPGAAFLRSVRTSFNEEGRFVEHVVSLLDPSRFTLHLKFGENE